MKSNKEKIYDFIKLHLEEGGVSTQYIAQALNLQRTNVSRILSSLVKEEKVHKTDGRPVLYHIEEDSDKERDNCFLNMVGHGGSMKRAVQLAKAAVLYPQKSLNSVIIGARGTGKSLLAVLMHKFAVQSGVLSANAKIIIFDCRNYVENEQQIESELLGDRSHRGCFTQAEGGVLVIDNAQYLNARLRNTIVLQTEKLRAGKSEGKKTVPIVIVICDNKNSIACDDFTSKFPIIIELPSLGERPLQERMELIQKFLALEAARIKKTLNISAELLRCLLLYECETNCIQLKMDIKIGCANAYVREHKGNDTLQLFISDFDHHVRKGFLKYKAHQKEIEQIIPSDYSYSFSDSSMKMSSMDKEKLNNINIYDELDRKASFLASRGLEDNEITLLLSTEVESIFRRYQNSLTREVINKEQMAMLVDKRIINLVEIFLNGASAKLGRNFSTSVFYGLCLHLNSAISERSTSNKAARKRILDILENYKSEYLLSMELSLKIKQIFEIELSIEEIILIAMFISYPAPTEEILNKPVILFAFYGDGVASSISKTITGLTHLENVFAFELAYEKSTEEVYLSLKAYISRIDRGKGVIVVYDSSMLAEMLVSIEEELRMVIRQLSLPVTTIGIELARKAAIEENVDTVYRSVRNNLDFYGMKLKKMIVTICTTGKGAAEELKHYIEQYGDVEDAEIISLSMSDKEVLRDELIRLMRLGDIQFVVGTFDPGLFSLPFLSIGEIFGTPKERLPSLLRLSREDKRSINYEEVFEYLTEQLEHTNITKLRRLLPGVLSEINSKICGLSVDTEVGLFIHISCCIDRLLAGISAPVNIRRELLIARYQHQFKEILKLVKPLEKAFNIIFNDDEIANILTIIYKV